MRFSQRHCRPWWIVEIDLMQSSCPREKKREFSDFGGYENPAAPGKCADAVESVRMDYGIARDNSVRTIEARVQET
jgi:hypothetical protein